MATGIEAVNALVGDSELGETVELKKAETLSSDETIVALRWLWLPDGPGGQGRHHGWEGRDPKEKLEGRKDRRH